MIKFPEGLRVAGVPQPFGVTIARLGLTHWRMEHGTSSNRVGSLNEKKLFERYNMSSTPVFPVWPPAQVPFSPADG